MSRIIVPVTDPHAQYQLLREEIIAAIQRVAESGTYILGSEVEGFELEFGEYLGVSQCIGVANGTDAIAIALRAVGIVPGDQVITVSHSAVATAAAIRQIGATTIFVDVDPLTRCIDPAKIEDKLTNLTRAIVPVHLYGQPAPMPALMDIAAKHKLLVVEDCAQAHGASINGRKVGTFGDAAAFSFYPTKNLGALGDGGLVATCRKEVAERARLIAQYGWRKKNISECDGINSRLDELQAAVLRCKLKYLDQWNAKRRSVAEFYQSILQESDITTPSVVPDSTCVYHLYVIESSRRDYIRKRLSEAGIQTAFHYPLPIHRQPAFAAALEGKDPSLDLPVTEALSTRILTLPMFAELTDVQLESVGKTLKQLLT